MSGSVGVSPVPCRSVMAQLTRLPSQLFRALVSQLAGLRNGPPTYIPTMAVVAGIYFLLMQWSFLPLAEFDAYYHMGITEVIREHGFIRTFPWMTASILRDHFHDPQLLLHLMTLPLLGLGVDSVIAGKLVAAVTATIFSTTFHFFLHRQRVRFAPLWTLILLFASPYLMARLTFVKTTALFISLLLALLIALFEERRGALFVLSWLTVLTYQGFPLVVVVALLYLGLRALLREERFQPALLFPIFMGVFAGLIVSPFFPNNLRFLHFELVQQILLKPKELALGAEWEPISTNRFFSSCVMGILFLFGSEIFATVARARSDARLVLVRSLAVILLLGALLSARLIDYFVPFALLASAMTVSRGLQALGDARLGFRVASGIALFLCLPLAALNVKEALRITSAISRELSADEYAKAAEWLKHNSSEGEVVISQWDDFPMMFFYDRHNRYLWGLNAAYGYGYDPRIYALITLMFEGRVRDPESYLRQVHSRLLLVGRSSSYPGRRVLLSMLKSNAWFDEVLEAGSLHLFQLRDVPRPGAPVTDGAPSR